MKKNIFIAVFVSFLSLLLMEAKMVYSNPADTKIESIIASSTLEPETNKYNVNNIIDGTLKSWSEGAKGDGIGESITITFAKPIELKSIYIYNGIPRDFYLNNRVKDIDINGKLVTLKDTKEMQKIDFADSIKGNKIKLTIKSIYKGSKWDDTCITEISFKPLKLSDGLNAKNQKSEVTYDQIIGYWEFANSEGNGYNFKNDYTFENYEPEGGTGTWSFNEKTIIIEMNYDFQIDEDSNPQHFEYTLTLEILEFKDNYMKVKQTNSETGYSETLELYKQ